MKRLLLVFVLLFGACSPPHDPAPQTVVENISQIHSNNAGWYQFTVERNDGHIGRIYVNVGESYVRLQRDPSLKSGFKVSYSCGTVPNADFQCKSIPEGFSNWMISAAKLTINMAPGSKLEMVTKSNPY